MCSSQAFDLATTTERLKVGGGSVWYLHVETSYKAVAKLIIRLTV